MAPYLYEVKNPELALGLVADHDEVQGGEVAVNELSVPAEELVVLDEVAQVVHSLRHQLVRVLDGLLRSRKNRERRADHESSEVSALRPRCATGGDRALRKHRSGKTDLETVCPEEILPYLSLLVRQPLVKLHQPGLAKVVDDEKTANHVDCFPPPPSSFSPLSLSLRPKAAAKLSRSPNSLLPF